MLCGTEKGKKCEVMMINIKRDKAIVTWIKSGKKHLQTTTENKAGMIPKERLIHLSTLENIKV